LATRYTIPYVLSTKLEKPVLPLLQFNNPDLAKMHTAPNPRMQKLMAIEDPMLSLFPAVTKKLYPRREARCPLSRQVSNFIPYRDIHLVKLVLCK
jgi:hypothetical protein